MRILGLDFGVRRIGVAASDPLGITAQPHGTLQRTSLEKDIQELKRILEEKEIGLIVIGLPVNMDGSQAVHYQDVLDFIEEIKKKISVPIETWDERLTTAQAERMLIVADTSRKKRKQVIDKLAASLILESYMNANPQKVSRLLKEGL